MGDAQINISEAYLNIIIAAAVGSLFTLLVQAGLLYVRNRRIKKSLDHFFETNLKVTCNEILKEIEIVKKALYSSDDISLGMHPSLNSRVLKSFTIDKLYSVYGARISFLIDIISILDNLESRKPYLYFNEFVSDVKEHMLESTDEESTDEESSMFETYEDHFLECEHIVLMRDRLNRNLDHVKDIIDDLYYNILELKK